MKRQLGQINRNLKRRAAIRNWQSTPAGQASQEVFNSLWNSQAGKNCILICNGPSLNKVRLEELNDVYSIGMNKINLMFDRTTFRPNLIVAVNQHVIEQNSDFYNTTDIPLLLSNVGLKHITSRKGVTFFNSYSADAGFSTKPADIIFEMSTVTYSALQIAFHMGFSKVGIVGADHNYAQSGKPHELQLTSGPDVNHFDPRYFSNGVPWQLADIQGSEQAYRLARMNYELAGRKIYNCTDGGHLEVFERISLSDFLKT